MSKRFSPAFTDAAMKLSKLALVVLAKSEADLLREVAASSDEVLLQLYELRLICDCGPAWDPKIIKNDDGTETVLDDAPWGYKVEGDLWRDCWHSHDNTYPV